MGTYKFLWNQLRAVLSESLGNDNSLVYSDKTLSKVLSEMAILEFEAIQMKKEKEKSLKTEDSLHLKKQEMTCHRTHLLQLVLHQVL